MSDTKRGRGRPRGNTPPAQTRTYRLSTEDENRVAQLVQHFAAATPIPVTPSDIVRLAIARLAEAELNNGKKISEIIVLHY